MKCVTASLRRLTAVVVLVPAVAWTAAAAPIEPPGRHKPTQAAASRARTVLHELYALRYEAPLWTGDAVAEARRIAMLALFAREQRLDPTAAPDTLALAARFTRAQPLAAIQPIAVSEAENVVQAPAPLPIALISHELWEADRAMTREALAYMTRRRGGEPVDAATAGLALGLLDGAPVGFELAIALLELRFTEALGGWRKVGSRANETSPATMPVAFVPGGSGTAGAPVPARPALVLDAIQLRRRLVQSHDLPARHLDGKVGDAVIAQAVRSFQRRHGLKADGTVGALTLAALNAPVDEQIRRVSLNVERLLKLAPRAGFAHYVEVNIPAYELRVVENGQVTLRSKVIVGDQESATPIFDDLIRYIELNPYWYVPPKIAKELYEKAGKDPSFFERNGFYVRTSESGRSRLIQRPGPENALGQMKFLFPNHHAVYLHDTSQRRLFARSDRTLSHGCVRVERPMELAVALIGRQGWDRERITRITGEGRMRRIEIAEPVPVFLDYVTTIVDEQGRLRFLPDVYKHDAKNRVDFPGKLGLEPPPVIEPLPDALPIGTDEATEPGGGPPPPFEAEPEPVPVIDAAPEPLPVENSEPSTPAELRPEPAVVVPIPSDAPPEPNGELIDAGHRAPMPAAPTFAVDETATSIN